MSRVPLRGDCSSHPASVVTLRKIPVCSRLEDTGRRTTAPSRPESYHVHDVAPYSNLKNGLTFEYLLGRAYNHEHRHM
jgi:hypothetical protein